MNKSKVAQLQIFRGVREELKKVTWPTRSQTIQLTVTVFVISLIVAFYVGIIDLILAKILEIVTTTS